ncbi:DoxX family protein [Streptomyces sp. NA04227]|uniref:DoxX family protein n=1 Tax=Streptomyces sp. NA04227 TaxID=2742136 RepID=UPI0015913801|nr:DoxX family protein [Streptomyces sp. NA04227]QKW06173.1 DoxX family protein [Streptomyces sp. NA04227]
MTCYDRKDMGLLLLRLGAGGILAAHGSQKLFGWFGGGGIEGTSSFMESVGYSPGKASAVAAGVGELGSGALLALGLATPAAGGAAMGTMAGASAVLAPKGFWSQSGGYEYPLTLGLIGTTLAVMGPGRLSLDDALRHKLNRGWMVPAALGAAAAAASVVVCSRGAGRSADEGDDGDGDVAVGEGGNGFGELASDD